MKQSVTEDPTQRRKTRRTLAVIVFIALTVRLVISPYVNVLVHPKNIQYWEPGNMAMSLLAGHGFGSTIDSAQPSAMMTPIYPLIVAVFFHFFGVRTDASIVAVHVFDCLMSALACIPIFLLARRSFGRRAGWWAAWGWAFSPYGIYFSATYPWSTHLLLFCLCCLLVLAQHLEQSARPGLWAGFGLLAGFAGLTEPSVLVVIPFLLALACWRLRKGGKSWLVPGCVASLAMAAALSPWMIRNAVVFHRFIPMRDNMGLELWMGNNGYELRWTSDDLHPLHDAQERAEYDRGELAYLGHKMLQAKAWIGANPGEFLKMSLRRATYLWTGYWSFDREYLELEPMDPVNIPFSTCLTLLALCGLAVAWHKKPVEAIRYAGVLFLFPIMYYFSHPETYHMRTLDPLIVILGCCAILALRDRLKAGAALALASEPAGEVAGD